MPWEIHPAKATFASYAEDWDRLNSKYYNSHPYFDSRFVGPLLDFFASGKELLCINRTNDVISGALILQPVGMGRWSSFQPSQAQVTAVFLDDACLLESLLVKLPGFAWTIELLAIDPRYSPDFSRLALPQIAHAHARTIGIQTDTSFPGYWGKRPKKLIANMNRYSRRAENELGTLTLSRITNADDIVSGVKRFGDLETAGWKGAAGTAVSNTNQQGAFYLDVLRRFILANQATVYELHAGDRLASSRLVIANDQMVVFLKTTYDESLSRFAPGRILLHRVIEEQFGNQSSKTIEFYTNATRDQVEWATFVCIVQNVQIFKSFFFAVSFALLKVVQQKLKGEDSRSPKPDEIAPTDIVHAGTSIDSFFDAPFDLSEFAAGNNIEVSLDWFDLLQKKVYPNDQGVRYYFVAEGDRPRAILPLRLTKKGRVKTIESLGNYYTSLYTPLLAETGDIYSLRHMLATAARDHGDAHVMRFAPMDPESPVYKGLLSELRAIGWIPLSFFCFGNWFLKVKGNWDDYLRDRSANLRSSIKRRNKEFKAAGGTLEIVTSPEGIEQVIDAFLEVYSASWKIPEPYPDFVPSLIRLLSANGMLRLGIARLREKPIAAQLWIVAQDKASIYKLAYHEAYASFSPGTVLTAHLMKHVIDNDSVKEIDFLIGDDKHKRIWMSDRRERWGIVAYNPRTVTGFALFLKEAAGRIVKPFWKILKNTSQSGKNPGQA